MIENRLVQIRYPHPLFRLLFLIFLFASCKAKSPSATQTPIRNSSNVATKSVADFGAKGDGKTDDTKAIQRAFDAYKKGQVDKIIFNSGFYRITNTLRYQTKGYSRGINLEGAGESTVLIFDFENGEPLIKIDGSSSRPYQFQRGGEIKNIHIKGKGTRSKKKRGAAIQVTGWFMFELEDIIIRQVNGSGLEFPLRTDIDTNPDAYASVMGTIKNVEISFCNGWGIDASSGIGFCGNLITKCRIGENSLGGIKLGGHFNKIEQNSIFSNGNGGDKTGGGIYIQRVQSNANQISVINNELDNNKAYHIWIDGILGANIIGNRCNSWNSVNKDKTISPPIHFLLNPKAKRASVQYVKFEGNYHRSQHRKSGAADDCQVILYNFADDSNISHITIENPIIPIPDNTPNLKLHNNIHRHSHVQIIEKNQTKRISNENAAVSLRLRENQVISNKAKKIKFNNVWKDYQGNFNVKNEVFIAPFTGLYDLSLGITLENFPIGKEVRIYLKGDITYKVLYFTSSNEGTNTYSNSCNILLQEGGKIWLEIDTNAKGKINIKQGDIYNWFDIRSIQ